MYPTTITNLITLCHDNTHCMDIAITRKIIELQKSGEEF
jgi:hypothetical protein